MTARHYDVVVLGRSLGSLLSASILAKRELKVLVLGQRTRAPVYTIFGTPLLRRTFTLLSATSPVFRRALQELAQTQRFRRRTIAENPMFGFLGPGLRFEIPPDIELFTREIEREFPEIQQVIAEIYGAISDSNAKIDAVFEKPAIWPPATFLERLETGRYASHLPIGDASDSVDELPFRLPTGHPYREILELPAFFGTPLGIEPSDLSPFSLARLHGAWARGVYSLPGGEQEFASFLMERIESHGGTCRLDGRVTRIVTRRGHVVGIEEDFSESMTGTDAIVTDSTGEDIASLCEASEIRKNAREVWPHVSVLGGHFVVSAVLPDRAIPAPLAAHSFLAAPGSHLPALYLERRSLLSLAPGGSEELAGKTLLTAECVCPEGRDLLGMRDAVLASLRAYIPFFEENVELVDSPHDGLPAVSFEGTGQERRKKEIDRVHFGLIAPAVEPMRPRYEITPLGFKGLAGEPLRGPVDGTFLVGPTVLPTLGQEGEALAALSVAHLLTRRDASRQRMRRQLWNKTETP